MDTFDTSKYYFYRVQEEKSWYRRKWQGEWDDALWAQRGYTRIGVMTLMKIRFNLPVLDCIYIRVKVIVRRTFTNDDWYRNHYDFLGRLRFIKEDNG